MAQISQQDIDVLLKMIKKSLVDSVAFPEKGKKVEFEVASVTDDSLFKVSIFRGSINSLKYNIGARIIKNGIPLLELHVEPSNRHYNPDGEVIEGSHWHIYSEEYGRGMAFPAENIRSEDFEKNTLRFLDKFNVIEKPKVYYQCELT